MNSFPQDGTTIDLLARALGDSASSVSDWEPSDGLEALAGQLALQMRRRWRQGEQVLTEEYLTRHPELVQQPAAAIAIIYEEIHLRQEQGQQDVWPAVLARFPDWQQQLQALRDCHHLLDAPELAPRFPAVGESIGEFQLAAELGRGALGRVFLATQPALANRPVVLKITPQSGREHLSLARLQHTNIVPLFAARDDRARRLRLLCMPYFGGAALSDVLRALAPIPLQQRTGQHLLDAVDQIQAVLPLTMARASGLRSLFARASCAQVICWIGACCADALQYAHERGLVHLDLKPSNVLIAADGQPMLLDFHLAHEPLLPGKPPPEGLGGTPAYMAPEHRAAAEAVGGEAPIAVAVDARADVYSLGASLYEALGGRLPCQAGSAPPLHRINPQVSVGLSDIIGRCLAANPGDRYQDAATLAVDLRRHLTDRRLQGVANRSLAERWRKWRRRQPATFRLMVMAGFTLAALAALATGTWLYMAGRMADAERALAEGKKQLREHQDYADADVTLRHGLALLENLPWGSSVKEQLRAQLVEVEAARQAAARDKLVRELHSYTEEMRLLLGVDPHLSGHWVPLIARCRALWEQRGAICEALGSQFAEAADDLREFAILWTDLQVRQAPLAEAPQARRQAVHVLEEARALLGRSAILEHELAQHRQALGMPTLTSPHLTANSAREHYALGCSYLRSGELERASEELKQALALKPHCCWSNYYYGLCSYRLKRYDDAALAFSVSIGAAPGLAGLYYNRALAFADGGRTDLAVADYNRALELAPKFAAAALNRGMLHFQESRYDEAVADLQRALQLGADPATAHYDLALVYLRQGKPDDALAHARKALTNSPTHAEARSLVERLEKKRSLHRE
jgi:serine/threonine protein kinase/Tfp pilus assembly protein PilF